MYEADDALSRADFIRILGIASRELSEVTYWLRIVRDMNGCGAETLEPLHDEACQLRRITKAMIVRSKANSKVNRA